LRAASQRSFWRDAREGKLANVVFVDPSYTDRAEDMGTSKNYHPWGNLLVAEGFLPKVHNALKKSPQWDRMVFVLNFDEHGGFFDHVSPPECQDNTKLAGPGPHPNLKRLGFRRLPWDHSRRARSRRRGLMSTARS
jgi:phospholipase C